ncbi:MAG TPA: ATP-binding protein [Pyrinomonadaceae bacterium]|nr:ATP-binding protein [Pyrinomonadaceae bacterium]
MIEYFPKSLARRWQALRVRFNLQWKILLLVAVSMSLILFTSSYLHTVRTRAVVARDHYENALDQTLVLTNRISAYDYFSSLPDLQQEMRLVAGSRPDFKQIDVYQNFPAGPRLLVTTAPGKPELLSLSHTGNNAPTQPRAGITSSEITRNNSEYWLIRTDITSANQSGFIEALVLKSAHHQLVDNLHREYNLVLFGALLASVGLLYLLFNYFFRRPVREILQAMAETRGGSLLVRAPVRRDDELGAVARGFNQLMDGVAERSREREDLLHQISDLNAELLKKVEIATSELRAANADLIRTQQRLARSERMAAIGQVTASLAHEIGTPLNAVAGHLQLLDRNHRDAPDTQRRLKIINAQLAIIVQTVKSLLERTHRPKIVFEPTDINATVQQLLMLVGPMLESRNIKATITLDQNLPCVSADRDSLHQVFLNLVNNSCDAMLNGGELEITTRHLRELRQVEIMFSDSGAGIAPSVAEHLFEPMFTTKQSGSGLGLVIARDIIAEHCGRIELVSGSSGAVFLLALPVAEPHAVAEYIEVEKNAA